MSAGRAGAAALALLMGGCFFWGWDEDHLDVDAISVESILVAGESTATVVVGYPHRAAPKHSPPEVQVELAGPGWHVPALAGSYYHCPIGPWYWPSAVREDVPIACLIADLPESIREGVSYELKGMNLTRFPTEDRCRHSVSPIPSPFKGERCPMRNEHERGCEQIMGA